MITLEAEMTENGGECDWSIGDGWSLVLDLRDFFHRSGVGLVIGNRVRVVILGRFAVVLVVVFLVLVILVQAVDEATVIRITAIFAAVAVVTIGTGHAFFALTFR